MNVGGVRIATNLEYPFIWMKTAKIGIWAVNLKLNARTNPFI